MRACDEARQRVEACALLVDEGAELRHGGYQLLALVGGPKEGSARQEKNEQMVTDMHGKSGRQRRVVGEGGGGPGLPRPGRL